MIYLGQFKEKKNTSTLNEASEKVIQLAIDRDLTKFMALMDKINLNQFLIAEKAIDSLIKLVYNLLHK